MYASAYVLGFHGCDERVGEKILRDGTHLTQSANAYDWLGSGIYFWENSPERARHWAEFIQAHPTWFRSRIRRPFVIGAIIDLGRCLDLTEAGSLGIVRTAFREFEATFKLAKAPMPINEGSGAGDNDLVKRHLDCAIVNHAHELRRKRKLPAFDTVRGAFFEGKPLYPEARIMERTHIQLCVRNLGAILGYFRPIPAPAGRPP